METMICPVVEWNKDTEEDPRKVMRGRGRMDQGERGGERERTMEGMTRKATAQPRARLRGAKAANVQAARIQPKTFNRGKT